MTPATARRVVFIVAGGLLGCVGRPSVDGGVVDPRCVPDASAYEPQLTVSFDGGLAYEPLRLDEVATVELEGLPPCVEVDLTFTLPSGAAAGGRFVSDFSGVVSTAVHAPVEGSWAVSDAEGPLWSMIGPAQGDLSIDVTAEIGTGVVLDAIWKRRPWANDGDALPVRGYKGVWGDLFVPPGAGPFPAVLVLGDPQGGARQPIRLAQMLMAAGFMTFGVWYVDPENTALPSTHSQIPLEYFQAALEVLREHRDVRRDRVALVGVGRGGEAALLTAAHSAEVVAVVAVAASGLSWPAAGNSSVPAWTFEDAGVPTTALGPMPATSRLSSDGRTLISTRPAYASGLAGLTSAERERLTTPVERINGPVLLLGASDDQLWPSCELSALAFDRLRDAGHGSRFTDDAVACLDGAGHALDPALVGYPLGDADAVLVDGVWLDYGGTAQATARANRTARQQVIRFLDTALKRP